MVYVSHINKIRYKKTLIIAFFTNIIFLILNDLKFDESIIIYAAICEFLAALILCIEYINIVRYALKKEDNNI